MLDLLPVLDHFQLAVKSALRLRSGQANPTGSPRPEIGTKTGQADQAFQEGIQMIFDQLMNTLLKYGLTPFNAEKQAFDPKKHEAISSLPSATEPEGVILAQSRQGYLFKNRLLRPAQVVVSNGAPKTAKTVKTEAEPTDTDLQPDEK
jgi:molecular chaperone GrpE (heat shock protein)